MLQGKNILLGVCGSIASYKSATLIRLLVKAGANVRVIMTPGATNFIAPLTLSTLSKNPVLVNYFETGTGSWNNHVELGIWADYILIAPISANTIAKLAAGLCDNLLSAVYLSARCPVLVAPAMDLDMWKHQATQANINRLQEYGNIVLKPGYGELASGLIGDGRMTEPEDIILFLEEEIKKKLPLKGKTALVTAGPTYEAIDPVRFIGNHSSGKMGYAIAEALTRLGAEVTLISGPTALQSSTRIHRIDIVSAQEMLDKCLTHFPASDIAVMSAAVADYRPGHVESQKIKKNDAALSLSLEKTTDILLELGKLKRDDQILVGFALETNDEEANAIAKVGKKNLDFIVLNSLNDAGAGFKGDLNKITIIDNKLQQERFPLKSKHEVAMDISNKIVALVK